MSRLPGLWSPLLLIIVGLMLAACGNGEQSTVTERTATPGATATPPIARTVTPASPATVPTPGEVTGVSVNLAETGPLLTIFAADKGDLQNDTPAVTVGDFNNDGVDDLLMGARFADGPGTGTSCDDGQTVGDRCEGGEAYVIFGSSDLKGSVDIAQGQQNLTIFGAKPGDNLGYSVASGDVNDDGIDDIIVSSPLSEGPQDPDYRTDRGETYVVFGRSDLGGTVDVAAEQQDVTIIAAEGFSLMGDSLAIGDVNGDGVSDIILGAPFAGRVPGSPHGGPRTELGEVYVVFGSSALKASVSVPKGEQDFTIKGPEQFSELGDAVTSADVNGDGIDDIIAVAEAADGPDGTRRDSGDVYVVFGSSSLGDAVDLAQDEQDVTILAAEAYDAIGFSAASGDVNGDGIADIMLVAQRADGIGNSRDSAGEAYVIFGSEDLPGTIDVAQEDQDVTIVGAKAHDLLSSCVGGADLNGDTVGDLLLGTGFASGASSASGLGGQAYIEYGSPALPATIDLSSQRDATIYGADLDDRFGSSLWTGDLNGDGVQEIIAVAPYADGPDNARPDAGEVYVIVPPEAGG
jgi:hypothetical protein